MDAGDGEDVEVPRQPRQSGSMTTISVRTTQNACLGSDLSLGPLARRSRVCKSVYGKQCQVTRIDLGGRLVGEVVAASASFGE
jgi:hypothetical protein